MNKNDEIKPNESALTDKELENVSGGVYSRTSKPDCYELVKYPNKDSVEFVFQVGQTVKWCQLQNSGLYYIRTGVISSVKKTRYMDMKNWSDSYYYDVYNIKGTKGNQGASNQKRDVFLK